MSCESHPDGDLFDELFPPAENLAPSDEYSDPSQVGMYGRSDHDRAIVTAQSAIDPFCIWSILECEGCLYAAPGLRVVNWMYYYISANPWTDPMKDYQLTIETEEEDDEEALYASELAAYNNSSD